MYCSESTPRSTGRMCAQVSGFFIRERKNKGGRASGPQQQLDSSNSTGSSYFFSFFFFLSEAFLKVFFLFFWYSIVYSLLPFLLSLNKFLLFFFFFIRFGYCLRFDSSSSLIGYAPPFSVNCWPPTTGETCRNFVFYLTRRAAYRFSSISLFPTRWYRPIRYYSSSTLLDNWSTIKDETGWNQQKSGRKTASKFWFPVAFRLLCRLSAVCVVSRWEPKMHLSLDE